MVWGCIGLRCGETSLAALGLAPGHLLHALQTATSPLPHVDGWAILNLASRAPIGAEYWAWLPSVTLLGYSVVCSLFTERKFYMERENLNKVTLGESQRATLLLRRMFLLSVFILATEGRWRTTIL